MPRCAARRPGRIRLSDHGSSTIEIALAAPLFVAVLLFVVLCYRLTSAQLDLDTAAHAAARAASLARTIPAAHTDGRTTALDTLTAHHLACRHPAIRISIDRLQPGGTVTATVDCTVPLADLALLAVPGSRHLHAQAVSPIDTWRSLAPGPPAAQPAGST